MSKGFRTALFQLVTNVLVLIYFVPRFLADLGAGTFDGPDGLIAAARFLLFAIVAAIVASIVIQIVGAILVGIANRGALEEVTDERDRIIDLTGERLSHWLSGIGLVVGLVVVWRGGPSALLPALGYLGFALGDIASNTYKLTRYIRG